MADLNNEAQEFAAVMRQVNQELAQFGKLTAQTAEQLRDAEMKAKYGIDNFTAGTKAAGGAVLKYMDAHTEAAKAVYNGERGAKAFNKSLDSLTEAAKLAAVGLSVMIPGGPLIKGVVAGLGLLAAKVYELSQEYTKAANVMSDTLFKGFQDMSQAGGSAADGMKGLFNDTKKLGLSMSQLDTFVQLVNKNSSDLALLGQTVYDGRKKFADMGEAMETSRQSLMNMGLTQEQINEGAMSYIRLQNRVANTNKMTAEQLAEGARKYLVEQDALTKLTGASRQEQEDIRQAALTEEMFAAQIRELRIKGDEKSLAAAKNLEEANIMATKVSKDFGSAFRASVTGNLLDPAAQKLNMSAQGEQFRQIERLKDGTTSAADAITNIGRAVGKSGDEFQLELAKLGASNDVFLNFAEVQKIRIATERDLGAALKKIEKDQRDMGAKGGKAADAAVAAQVQLTQTQQKANKILEEFVEKGVVTATREMITFAERVEFAGKVLGKISDGKFYENNPTNNGPKTAKQEAAAAAIKNVNATVNSSATEEEKRKAADAALAAIAAQTEEATARGKLAPRPFINPQKIEARAAGGPVKNGNPYLVGENGPELFVPSMAGDIVPIGGGTAMTRASGQKAEQIERAVREIINDTKTLEKITDTDLQRTKKFSDVQKKYYDLKTSLYEEQIGLMSTSTSGGGSSAPSMGGGGGLGLKAPAPVTGAGGVGSSMSQDDLAGLGLKIKSGDVQAQGAGISPKIIEMAQQVQANMPNFAYFSGFNDKFHQENSPSSFHTKGQAMDFALNRAPSKEEGQEIVNWLKSMGASTAIDEYNNPSSKSTAGHIHAQIAGYADGGIANEPQIAMVAEKGPEAMVPLKNGAIPVEGFQEAVNTLRSMQEQMSIMASAMSDMVREQRSTNDISTKILQVSAN